MTDAALTQANPLIRARMAQGRLKQEDVAQRLGIDQTTVSKKLRGLSPWDPRELAELALYLDSPLLQVLATRMGHVASATLPHDVAEQERLLASDIIQEALRRLPSRERQTFFLIASLVFGGLAPIDIAREAHMLRSLSHFDLTEVSP